jgi:hypothetical protein
MMPAIQDFERRLGILHQVEPILENAISTLSKVVDLNSALPATPVAKHKSKPVAAPAPDINQLKALLANAQKKKAVDEEPAGGSEDELSALLGGGGGSDLSALLGETAEAEAPTPEPEAPAESTEEEALASLGLGGGGGEGTSDLLAKLLGAGLLQTDSDMNFGVPISEAQIRK